MPVAPTLNRTVELEEFEKIVPRGTSVHTWHIRVEGGWLPAMRVPGATAVKEQAEPGMVWQRRVRLELPGDARLRLQIASPQAPRQKDVFAILNFDQRSATKTTHVEYQLDGRGRLVRAEPRR